MTHPDMVIALAWMAVVLHGDANRTAVKWFTTQCRENRFKVPANPAGSSGFGTSMWTQTATSSAAVARQAGAAP
jgi:hypothetical protein